VQQHLQPALTEADKDAEHVHQLRVATRRAGAALRIFAPCLPQKVQKSARKHLRRIRRAAAEARDWDVFLLDLAERERRARNDELPGYHFLVGYAVGQREAAQGRLEEMGEREGKRWPRIQEETVDAVREPQDGVVPPTLRDLACPALDELLQQLHTAASGDLGDYEHLHQVRILGKRLRYAMEVFAECFPEVFRAKLYPAVEEMQDILGLANDSHVAIGRLGALRDRLRGQMAGRWKRLQPGIETLLRSHQRRLPQERRRFLKWWRHWQEAGLAGTYSSLLREVPVGS
jgi:CHAD domain-containing protein